MGLFSNLTTDGVEETEERVGGGSFVRESGIYTMNIKLAYAGASDGGAQNITFVFDDGKEFRTTVYYTDRNGNNFYHPKKPNSQERDTTKKVFLPGFETVNDICILATDKGLKEQNTEEKVVNLWDKDAKRELPKSVHVLVDLLGKSIDLAILKTLENKTEQQGTDWVAIADTVERNELVKAFHSEFKVTVKEAGRATGGIVNGEPVDKDGNPVRGFYDKWLEQNQGKVKDKTDKSLSGNQSGRPGASRPQQSNANAGGGAPRKSLFGG